MIATATTALQYASVVAFAATIAVVLWGKRKGKWAAVCLPPVLWAAMGIAFYALYFLDVMSPRAFLLMSAAHRAIGAALILAMTIIVLGATSDE